MIETIYMEAYDLTVILLNGSFLNFYFGAPEENLTREYSSQISIKEFIKLF
jgi:hypothetical protein